MAFLLLPSTVLCAADHFAIRAADATDQESIMERKATSENTLKQMGAFKIRRNAERLAEELELDGMEAVVLAGVTNENQEIYRVYIHEQGEVTHADKPRQPSVQNVSSEKTQSLPSLETPAQPPAQDLLTIQEENLLLVVRNFSRKEYGEEFSAKMEKAGYVVTAREVPSGNGQTIYVVSAGKPQAEPSCGCSSQGNRWDHRNES